MYITTERRDRLVVVLFTQTERKHLDALAAANGMTRSAFVRHRALYDRPMQAGRDARGAGLPQPSSATEDR